jgi:hypothetical protein
MFVAAIGTAVRAAAVTTILHNLRDKIAFPLVLASAIR